MCVYGGYGHLRLSDLPLEVTIGQCNLHHADKHLSLPPLIMAACPLRWPINWNEEQPSSDIRV